MMKHSSSRIQQEMRILNVKTIVEMISLGHLNIESIWSYKTKLSKKIKSKIIESLILGLPLDTIWAEQDAFGKMNLLSGFDIVSSVRDFTLGNFSLDYLSVLKHLKGSTYDMLDYVEKRHLEQMGLVVVSISYDSNPLLKCMLIESLNKHEYSVSSAQLARNHVFPSSSMMLDGFVGEYINSHAGTNVMLANKREKFLLKIQRDIWYATLVVYLYKYSIFLDDFCENRRAIGLESYSYSRSYSINYEDNVDINYGDNLDYAVTKLSMMVELHHQKALSAYSEMKVMVIDILSKYQVEANTIGRGFKFNKNKEDSPSLLELLCLSVSREEMSRENKKLKSMNDMTVGELLRVIR